MSDHLWVLLLPPVGLTAALALDTALWTAAAYRCAATRKGSADARGPRLWAKTTALALWVTAFIFTGIAILLVLVLLVVAIASTARSTSSPPPDWVASLTYWLSIAGAGILIAAAHRRIRSRMTFWVERCGRIGIATDHVERANVQVLAWRVGRYRSRRSSSALGVAAGTLSVLVVGLSWEARGSGGLGSIGILVASMTMYGLFLALAPVVFPMWDPVAELGFRASEYDDPPSAGPDTDEHESAIAESLLNSPLTFVKSTGAVVLRSQADVAWIADLALRRLGRDHPFSVTTEASRSSLVAALCKPRATAIEVQDALAHLLKVLVGGVIPGAAPTDADARRMHPRLRLVRDSVVFVAGVSTGLLAVLPRAIELIKSLQ